MKYKVFFHNTEILKFHELTENTYYSRIFSLLVLVSAVIIILIRITGLCKWLVIIIRVNKKYKLVTSDQCLIVLVFLQEHYDMKC